VKTIILTGAGGAPAINFARSLRGSPENFWLVGLDSDKYCLQRAVTNEKHLVPGCRESDYLTVVNAYIQRTGAEFLYSQPDVEIAVLSENREDVACRMFLPAKESIRICQDKYQSYEKWRAAGLRVPQTMMIHGEADLRRCFREFGPKVWLREIQGAFGKGSLPTSDFDQANAWLDFHKGWGRFSGAECLEQQSVTWQSIWWKGELVVAQSRRRLYWEFANRSPSGVTGLTGTGVTMSDPQLDGLAQQAINAIDRQPHGIWSVDLTLDRQGVPNPTEINIARFFTTHQFFSEAGLNMPYLFVRLALGESLPPIPKRINPLPDGLAWIRGMDVTPALTTLDEIEAKESELAELRNQLPDHGT